jgi:hypothetical protein
MERSVSKDLSIKENLLILFHWAIYTWNVNLFEDCLPLRSLLTMVGGGGARRFFLYGLTGCLPTDAVVVDTVATLTAALTSSSSNGFVLPTLSCEEPGVIPRLIAYRDFGVGVTEPR